MAAPLGEMSARAATAGGTGRARLSEAAGEGPQRKSGDEKSPQSCRRLTRVKVWQEGSRSTAGEAKMRKFWMAAVAAGALMAAGQAAAAIIDVNFMIPGGFWTLTDTPFGIDLNSPISGTLQIDDSLTGKAAFTDLDVTTGTQHWTEADITFGNYVLGQDQTPYSAFIMLGSAGHELDLQLNGTGSGFTHVIDGQEGNGNSHVTATGLSVHPVPEPATWAMMIMGFGAIGAMVRRRRTAVA